MKKPGIGLLAMHTIQTLHELLITITAAQNQAVKDAREAQDKATAKAEESMTKRFESVNEFRQQLNDQTSTFVPRNEALAQFQRLEDKIERMQTERRGMMLSLIILGIGVIVNLVLSATGG